MWLCYIFSSILFYLVTQLKHFKYKSIDLVIVYIKLKAKLLILVDKNIRYLIYLSYDLKHK